MARISARKSFLAGSAAVAALVIAAIPAAARASVEAQGESAESVDIVVTGTRIRGEAPVGSALIGVTRDDILASSAPTVAQLLQETPQIFNIGISETARSQGGGSNATYGSSINIRGIGPFATLVLINGHRVVPQGTSGFAIDPSVVPTNGLERIDIVADGASAVYGSDAIAGVANLILRRNVQGFEFNARYGDGAQYNERQIGLVYGKKWSDGQFTIAYENGNHSALSGLDRDFYGADLRARGGNDYRSTLCAPGNIIVGGVSYAIPVGGVTAANASSLQPNTANRCDLYKRANLLPQQDHHAVSFTLDHRVSDGVRLFAEGFGHFRKFKTLNGDLRASTFTIPSTNPYFVAPPGTSPASVQVQYSPENDYPQLREDGWSRAINLLGGIEVNLPSDFTFEASYGWGRNWENQEYDYFAPTAGVLTAALNSTNPATAFNPFGVNENLDIAQSLLTTKNQRKGWVTFQGWEASVGGPLAALPGGNVQVALGYEGQDLSVSNVLISGTRTAPLGRPRSFSRTVHSFYGELLVPIFGSDNSIPGFSGLDLNFAIRRDDYSDVGHTTNPKIGINWAPVEGLRFHGSWGTSFRAPGIAQIYGNTADALNLFSMPDPLTGGSVQALLRTGVNMDLKPEEAETFSLGMDWKPSFAPGLRLNVTYWNVKYENQVVSYSGDTTLLQREALFAGTGVVLRNITPAFIAQQIAETGSLTLIPANTSVFVDGRAQNLGITKAQGIDFEIRYRFETGGLGQFALSAMGTRLLKWDTAVTPAAPVLDNLNFIYQSQKFRARFGVDWQLGRWAANARVNYLNSYKNNLVRPVQRVKAAATVDGQLTYNFGDLIGTFRDVRLGLDVRNLLDKDPPFVNLAQSNTGGGGGIDPTTMSSVGRVISMSLSTKF